MPVGTDVIQAQRVSQPDRGIQTHTWPKSETDLPSLVQVGL